MRIIIFLFICLLISLQPAVAAYPEELLAPSVPGGAFLTGEVLAFSNTARAAYTYEVLRQPGGEQVFSGSLGAEESLTLGALPKGYYILRARTAPESEPIDIRFAVLADPAGSPVTADSFFALDAPLSVLVHHRHAEKAVEIARRSGVKFIRERNPIWHRVEPKRDEIDYGIFARHLALFAAADIRVLSMYHTSPAWSRPLRPDKKMPDDLFALYAYSKRISSAFGDICPAFEFWNEMDFGGVDSAWDYAACLKAASLGYKAGRPGAKVLNGGFAIEAGDLTYHHVLMENGIGNYLDVLSLHSYGGIAGYPGFLRKATEFLGKYRCGHIPVWYTETGSRAEGKGQLEHDGKLKEHTLPQELLVAEFLVKQMIAAQFCGAERDFFFSLYPCNEEGGAKVWGLTRRDTLEVKAGYVAFAALNRELGAAQLLGRAAGLPAGTTGFLYRHPDRTHTLVVWRESAIDHRRHEEGLQLGKDQTVAVSFPVAGTASAIDVFSTPVELKSSGGQVSFDLGRMPVYLRGAAPRQTEPPRAVRTEKTGTGAAQSDKTIVFQAVFSSAIEIVAEEGPWKSKPCQLARFTAAHGQLSLFVYNFSNEAKTGTFTVAGADASGVPEQEFHLEPMSKKEFRLRLAPVEAGGRIIIQGRFGGRETTSLIIPFEVEGAKAEGRKMPLDRDGAWRLLSSGKATVQKLAGEDGLEFRTGFTSQVKDRWSYPEYSLLPAEALKEGDEISFELALDSPPEDLKFMQLLALFHEGGRQDFKIPLPAQTGQYTLVRISLKGFHRADKVRAIAVGGNLKSGEVFSYRIRNLMIVRK